MRRRLRAALLVAMAAGAVLAGVRYLSIRNDLQTRRQEIGQKWANVEAALQRRADALPVLMGAIGEVSEDSPVAREIARACAHLAGARGPDRKLRANREVSQALAKLLLHCDTDRKLRSSAAFRRLREAMAAYEDEIAQERFAYNDALEHYNAHIQRFPDNLVALLAGYARDDAYFGTGPDAPGAPNLLH